MTQTTTAFAPKRVARITAVLFLLTIVTGLAAQFGVSERLVVPGDATATALRVAQHKSLYQWGFTLYMVEMALQVAMSALFYRLLRPVSPSVALAALCLGLVGCVIKTMGRVFYLAPLFVLGGAPDLHAFTPDQLGALALVFLHVNDHAAGMALAFFGLDGVLRGSLIFRSTFLPRGLGVVSILAGIGWLTFLSPSLGSRLFPVVAMLGLAGSVAMIFWLLVFGVNEPRWRERAAGSR